MIRIDLSQDRLEQSAEKGRKSNVEISKIFVPVVKKIKLDLAGLLTLLVGGGLSGLFPLFLDQYKTYVRGEHMAKKRQLQSKSDQLSREIGKYTPFQKELESYEQQKKLVSGRLGVVRDLLTSRAAPVLVLDAVGQYLPKRTWINTIDLVLGDAGGSIQLSGSSYSNEDIAEYIDRLSDSVYLKDVSLEDVSTRVEDKIEVRGFQASAKTRDAGRGIRSQVPASTANPGGNG